MSTPLDQFAVFLVRVGSHICALPLENVVEIMRPLVTEPLPEMPSFLCGRAIIRGLPTPVFDLGILLGAGSSSLGGRFVLLRNGAWWAAAAVDTVLGVRRLDGPALESLPTMKNTSSEFVSAIEVSNPQLLLILQEARLIPNEVWQSLASSGVVT